MNPFYCEICRFYGKTSQSLKYHLSKNSCGEHNSCLLYTSPSPRDRTRSRMPSSA